MAISAPIHYTFLSGLSTAFSTGSLNKLEDGAVVQDVAAVHVSLSHGDSPSVSTEIAALRRLLLAAAKGEGDVSLQQLSSVGNHLLVSPDTSLMLGSRAKSRLSWK